MSYYERDNALTLAVEALQRIADWDTPGRIFYKNGQDSSFETAMGSNGVRDYFKQKAADTIEQIKAIKKTERKAFNVYVDDCLMLETDWYDHMTNLINGYREGQHSIIVKDGYGSVREEFTNDAYKSKRSTL
jgi:hypothetical protein